MKLYILEWKTFGMAGFDKTNREYFRYEVMAMSRQRELENMIKVLGIEMKASPFIYESLVKE